MRLVAGTPAAGPLDEGSVIDGYVVERAPERSPGLELRCAVRAPDGRAATLIQARWPHADRSARSHFRRMARLRARLEHPALVPVHTFGEHAGRGYLITDEYPAYTLADLLADEAPLAPRRVVAMMAPVAEAIDLASSRGLVHQALDPDSLLLARGDRVLIGSFGLLSADADPVWGFVRLGDPRYRSPEEVREEPLTLAATVYSLAAILVHALTGQPPFVHNRTALPYEHLYEQPPRVSEREVELPSDFDAVVGWGLAKEPGDRPQSAGALVRAAARALGLEEPALETPPAPTPLRVVTSDPGRAPARARGRAGRAVAWVAAAAVGGALLGAALDPFGPGDAQPAAQAGEPAVWQQLAERRGELRAELAAAETAPRQAQAAARLAGAYDRAATSAEPGRLAGAARSAASAYGALAEAAAVADATGYAEAAAAVAGAERRLGALARR